MNIELLTVPEVANMFRCPDSSIKNNAKKYDSIKHGRRWLFHPNIINQMIDKTFNKKN